MWISLFGRRVTGFVCSFSHNGNQNLKPCVINRRVSIGKKRKKRRSLSSELYIAIGFAGILIFAVVAKARAIANLVFVPGGISNLSFAGANPVMNFSVYAQNTAGTAVTVNSFAGNIFCNGTLIGNVSEFTPVTLPANSQTEVSLNAQLMGIAVVSDLIQSFSSGGVTQNINIKGNANGVGFQVPIDLSFSIGG